MNTGLSVRETDLRLWAEEAVTGDDIVYHEGPDLLGPDDMLSPVGKMARTLAEEGLLFLYQVRLSPHTRQYRARKLSKAVGQLLKPRRWEDRW